MAARSEIDRYLDDPRAPQAFRDYGANRLRLAGTPHVRTLVPGVTASVALRPMRTAFQ